MHRYDDLTTAPPPRVRESTPAHDAIQLHRMVGNRAFARLLARDAANQRPMGGKPDEAKPDQAGNRWVWDEFDRTLTIFAVAGGGVQIVYKAGAPEELAKLKGAGVESAVALSATRAKVLEFLRVKQGTYQEKESDIAARLAANPGQTLCNKFTGAVVSLMGDGQLKQAGALDPRSMAMKNQRAGAFHTPEDRPAGPKPGDIVSYGKILPPSRPGGLRRANFQTIQHIGVFKSRRTGSESQEIWTVVDGGQGKLKGRQEIRERTRTFATEELEIDIPTAYITEPGQKKGWVKDAEKKTMKVGVLKSKLADAGQDPEDKLLRGWLDIDEFEGDGPAPAVTSTGVNNRVFVGGEGAAKSAAEAGVLATE